MKYVIKHKTGWLFKTYRTLTEAKLDLEVLAAGDFLIVASRDGQPRYQVTYGGRVFLKQPVAVGE